MTIEKKAWLDERGNIKIQSPYSSDMVFKIKFNLPNRAWLYGSKLWRCALSIDAVRLLKEWGFALCPALNDFHTKTTQELQLKEIDIPGLKMELYPFQKLGVDFIEQLGGRALVADEMGLGKTAQSLAWLQLHRHLTPTIIVCPASLKLNWRKETRMWLPSPQNWVIQGRGGQAGARDKLLQYQILIINYDILSDWVRPLIQTNPKLVIFDEIHFTKNNKTLRTQAAKKLAKKAPHVLGLSGTPVINRPMELYNAINMINPTIFPSGWDYRNRYCGWDGKGATNTEELNKKLTSTIMLRRLKKDVLKDLPEKIRTIIPVELDNLQEYTTAERHLIEWIRENKGLDAANRASAAEQLARFNTLKQLVVKGKMKAGLKWVNEYLETGEKLVIFCTHKITVNILMEIFAKISVKIDGSVTGIDRQKAVDAFQTNDKIKLFVGNIKAAGVGLTLTAASSTCFFELGWTPGEHTQAEDRVHRIGQKADSVNAFYLLAENTIEDEIMFLLNEKQKILDQVLDGKTKENSLPILNRLVEKLTS